MRIFDARIKILILLFLLTGVGAYFSVREDTKNDSYNIANPQVAITDTSEVTEITLRKDGLVTLLNRRGEAAWRVNNKYEARPQLINLLLFGFSNLQVKRPLEGAQKDKIKKLLLSKGIQVTVDAKEKHTFYILTNDGDINSSYYLAGDENLYIVYVPGIKGDIYNVASLQEADWRSRDLFSSNERSLKSIRLTFPESPADNYFITESGGQFQINGLANADSSKLNKYIMLYRFISVDKYITEGKDSILADLKKRPLLAIIQVEDIREDKSNELKVYAGNNKLFGTIQKSGELVILNPQLFRYVLMKKSHFAGDKVGDK